MKYTISIDQVHAQEWRFSFSEAAIFSFCNELSNWADPILIDGQVWYFASRNKVIEELPWITEKPDTVYRAYKALHEKGVIRWQKHGEKDCVQLTTKGKSWNSEKNPSLGKKSEQARKNFRITSEKNPTDNNTIDNNTIDKREHTPQQSEILTGLEKSPPPCSAPPPAPQLPPEELAIQTAIDNARAYMNQWPAMRLLILEGARLRESDVDFDKELESWVRHHGDQFYYLSNITKKISSDFARWMVKAKQFNYGRQGKGISGSAQERKRVEPGVAERVVDQGKRRGITVLT